APFDDGRGYLRAISELARGCPSTAQLLMVHASAELSIRLLGTDAQLERFSAETIEHGQLFAYLGSEATQQRSSTGLPVGWSTTAARTAGGWLVNGTKFFATGSPGAKWMMVL